MHPIQLTKEEARQHLLALADVFYDMGFGGEEILHLVQKVLDEWATMKGRYAVVHWEKDAAIYGDEFKALNKLMRKRFRI